MMFAVSHSAGRVLRIYNFLVQKSEKNCRHHKCMGPSLEIPRNVIGDVVKYHPRLTGLFSGSDAALHRQARRA